MDFYDLKTELQKKEYNLKCSIHRERVTFDDDAYEQDESLKTADLIILEPYEGTERDMFMTAYYQDAIPKKNGEGRMVSFVDLPCWIASPISMPSMIRVQWPNEYFQKPHLLVTSYAIEKLFASQKNVATVDIRVYPFDKVEEFGLSDGVMRI
jgi:hypothetical protein